VANLDRYKAAAVLAALALSCGEPLGPRPFPWTEVYTFPGNVRVSAVTRYPHGLTFASGSVRDGTPAREYAVLYNDEAEFAEAYRSPHPDSAFEAVRSYFYRHCVAVGWRVAGTARRPLVVRYEGGTVYTEVDIPADVTASSFTKVYPLNEGVYWILGDDGVYLYEWGRWRRVADAAGASDSDLAVTEGGRAFYLRLTGGGAELAISDDLGASWTTEAVRFNPGLYEINPAYGVVIEPAGETVYLAARASVAGGDSPYAIIGLRDGAAPGNGSFDVAFAANADARGVAVKAMAFKDEAKGAAVGPGTSLTLEGEWRVDAVAPGLAMDFVDMAPDMGTGFYAVASYEHVPRGRRYAIFYAGR
jgi:hypothetical protein